jgi:transcription antitermination factor NusG
MLNDPSMIALSHDPVVVSTAGTTLDFRRMPGQPHRRPGGSWMLAHTKPRQEKTLGESLEAAGIACFVPLVRQVRFYAHRKRVSDLPLFPSYAFVFATSDEKYKILATKRIAQLIPVVDQTKFEHELSQIDLAIGGGAPLDPYPYLEIGRRVVVTRGPFMGLEGMVDTRRSWDRLILNVSFLGRATSLEIDAGVLEAVD